MKPRIKIVAVTENKDTPCWPYMNYDFGKKLATVTDPILKSNPEMDFDIVTYTERAEAERDYEADKEKYDGVLVLLMTCWKGIDSFYCRKAKEGLPVIVADVPYCGSGSILRVTSGVIRSEKLPVPMIASTDVQDIADAVRLFYVIAMMKKAKLLVVSNRPNFKVQEAYTEVWGCEFINRTAAELNAYFAETTEEAARPIADKWIQNAVDIREATDADILESARLYLAIDRMKKELSADAVTIACLELSYNGQYDENAHMYPCLSHYEMLTRGEIAVCEADLAATITSLVFHYLAGRPGFVSDPIVDTSKNEIIYSHCVACPKVYGCHDERCCKYNIRSHAEDDRGASVEVLFPSDEKLTTAMIYPAYAAIHSSYSKGSIDLPEACRSKLVASADAEKILENWASGSWHRVTVFGDYRKELMRLFKMKELVVTEEDK